MRHKILLTLFLLSLVSSAVLAFFPLSTICNVGSGSSGCGAVQSSVYASTFGISNSSLGVLAFGFMTLLSLSQIRNPHRHKERFIHLGVLVSSLVAIYFIYLQIFVIEAFCKYCLVVDFSSITSLILVLSFKYRDRKCKR